MGVESPWAPIGAPEKYRFCHPLTLVSFIFGTICYSKMMIWGNVDEWVLGKFREQKRLSFRGLGSRKNNEKNNVGRFAAENPEKITKKITALRAENPEKITSKRFFFGKNPEKKTLVTLRSQFSRIESSLSVVYLQHYVIWPDLETLP